MPDAVHLSRRALQTADQPISYFMQQAIENPKLISLAAGLVDAASLPGSEVRSAVDELLSRPASAQAALQYGPRAFCPCAKSCWLARPPWTR